MIYNDITELIGKTPLVRAEKFCEAHNINANLLLKLECFNPAGSIKDRAAFEMINRAVNDGKITEGATIIEPTSGNTGIGLAMAAARFGMKAILVMPDTMSVERQKILRAYGAEIVLTPGAEGMAGAIKRAEELKDNTENSFIPSQFDNPANADAHYKTTGPEIFEDTEGDIDVLVATVGTGGTVSGIGRYLKEKRSGIRVVAVEPEESPLISKGVSAPHKIQGIGANFVPENFDKAVVDQVLTVSAEEAYAVTKELATLEGILLGISSGAAISAATKLIKRDDLRDKTVVVICPDTGMRYLSTENLF